VGDPLLKRALKRLGVEARGCHVANGIGGEGQGVMTVSIYSVPGGSAADLEREFATVLHLPARSSWQERTVGQKSVQWAEGAEFMVAYWAEDGRVFHVTAEPGGGRRLKELIGRLTDGGDGDGRVG
jgi:hypothetical protein